MASDHESLIGLMVKYAKHETLTGEESRILESWLQESPENRKLFEELMDEELLREKIREMKEPRADKMWAEIDKHFDDEGNYIETPAKRRAGRIAWLAPWFERLIGTGLALGAAITIITTQPDFFRKSLPAPRTVVPTLAQTRPAMPAGNPMVSPIWIRSDGSTVNPDTLKRGDRITDHGLTLRKSDTNSMALTMNDRAADTGRPVSHLECTVEGAPNQTSSQSNWIHISNGPHRTPYRLRLPDSTNVVLFGSASLQYPIANGSNSREVCFEGKVLFDVAHDKGRPFVAHGPHDYTLVALGTVFQAEDYASDPQPHTSLIEGRLRVRWQKDSVLLDPLQEAVISEGRLTKQAISDSTAADTAERNNHSMHFDNTRLDVAARQVGWWYRASVSNPGGVEGRPFSGDLPGNLPLEEIVAQMNMQERGVASVRLEGTTIIISK